MLRLRTTTWLSLLALVAGVAGTGWLSTQTANGRAPPARAVASSPAMSWRHAALPLSRRLAALSVMRGRQTAPSHLAGELSAAPALLPLRTPADTSLPWEVLRGHLDGRAVVHLRVDGAGRVSAARLVESSGDPVLDDYALRSVRGWRFAVPPDAPDGLSGDLPMRFSTARAASVGPPQRLQDALDADAERGNQAGNHPLR